MSALRSFSRWLCHCPALAALAFAAGCLTAGPTGSSKPSAPRLEAEGLTRSGGKPIAPTFALHETAASFAGVLLYGNGDFVAGELDFPAPGRYRFEIRGSSSNEQRAGITVFVDDASGGTAYFRGTRPSVISRLVDVDRPGRQVVRLQVTTDIGESDTLLDWFAFRREADLLPPPRPAVEGAATTGRYRNLFAERGYDQREIEAKLDEAWRQLFHGDEARETVYYQSGRNAHGPLSYILDAGNDDVRSEGMSYGLMICVQLDHKAEFDALWNWARSFMYHADPKHPSHSYFSWSMNRDGTARDDMPAPDGEEYFITALYFAAARWGRGRGIYDYRTEADRLLGAIKNRPIIEGRVVGGRIAKATSLFHPTERQVRFTPDLGYFEGDGDHTDPSYHLPAFYELWARWGPKDDRDFWKAAATTSRDLFVRAAHPQTGLVPDYAKFDGSPKARRSDPGSATFRFDAWRAVMNWSLDHAWWAADPRQQELANRLLRFFWSRGISSHGNNFTLDGTQTSKDHSPGLVAMNATAALAATDAVAWRFVDELWSQPIPTGKWRYYDGMLYVLGLLNASGRYRVYAPAALE